MFYNRAPLILAVSARTPLPVLTPARDLALLGPRFAAALADVLRALKIAEESIREELREMGTISFCPTASRQILGTMNDFDRMLEIREGESLTSVALQLALAPCSPIEMESPDRLTVQLFAGARL